jgi:aspartyl-tRNA(Asn)/glutamyl-tRNA(Gln) amidotransferase subunit B
VTVLFGGKEYSPLNLKFQRVAPMEFANWNMRDPLFSGKSILPSGFVYEELKERLEKAVGGIFVTKVFPGMRGDMLISLMKAGVKYFILELYDTGTASLREGPFSLKKAFAYGKETGVRFFCTSQQEGLVDFSEYVTAHELWKEGAVPMGGLSTESAYTRLIAAALSAETDEELVRLMEV